MVIAIVVIYDFTIEIDFPIQSIAADSGSRGVG